MKRLLLITTCLLAATPAFGQAATMQSPAYVECTALANSNPEQALAKADAWLKIDDSIASQHCRAMALYGLRRFPEAADALAVVRASIAPENLTLRSYVTRQAVRANINASQADKALALINAQIHDIGSVKGDNSNASRLTSELLLDRARLNVTYGKLDDAAKDLDHAVSLTPVNEEVLLERAGVFEKLGDVNLAKNDIDAVLTINNRNAQAKAAQERLNGKAAAKQQNITVPTTVVAVPNVTPPANATDAANAAQVMPVIATTNEPQAFTAPSPLVAPEAPAPKKTYKKKPAKKVTPASEAP